MSFNSFNSSVLNRSIVKLDEEVNDKETAKHIQKHLKCYSLYFTIFGMLLLLNACIGFSSAPYYSQQTTCNNLPQPEGCQKLRALVISLYSFEILASVVLVFHGLIGLRAVEHTKSLMTMKFLSTYSKIAFITYVVCVIARCTLWYFVIKAVNKVSKLINPAVNFGTLYGDFLAVFVENYNAGIILTSLIILAICLCLIQSVFTIGISNRHQRFL